MMSTATAPGPVNLYQLGLFLGGVALDAAGDLSTGPVEITADVDQGVLEAAVAAHVADPSICWVDPDPTPVDPPVPVVTVPAGAVAELQVALDEHPPTLDGMHAALSTFAAALTTET